MSNIKVNSLNTIIRKAVNTRLIEYNFNQSKAARSLDISRGTLRKYMDKTLKQRLNADNQRLTEQLRFQLLEQYKYEDTPE